MQRKKNISILIMVVMTLILLSFLIFNNNNSDSLNVPIKTDENIFDNEYFSFLKSKVKNVEGFAKFVYIYLGDICMSCLSGELLLKLNDQQKERNSIKYYILLPTEFTKNDLDNLRNNYSLQLEFLNVGHSFDQLIKSQKSIEKPFPLSGLVVVTDSNGIVSFVDMFSRKDVSVKTTFEKLVDAL